MYHDTAIYCSIQSGVKTLLLREINDVFFLEYHLQCNFQPLKQAMIHHVTQYTNTDLKRCNTRYIVAFLMSIVC